MPGIASDGWSAGAVFNNFVIQITISGPKREFQTKNGSYGPMVPVSYSCPVKKSLVTYAIQSQPGDVTYIELGKKTVNTYKMTRKRSPGPIPELGLNHPMFDPSVFRKVPGIVISGYIQGKVGKYFNLHSRINAGGSIIKNICFHCKFLSV
jgi:hypothetical protein